MNKKTASTHERSDKDVIDIVAMMAQDQIWVLLHERFHELEEAEGLTQAELARKVGCDRQSVSRWLSGPSNIGIFNAAKLLAGMKSDMKLGYKPWAEMSASNYYKCFDEPTKIIATKQAATFRLAENV